MHQLDELSRTGQCERLVVEQFRKHGGRGRRSQRRPWHQRQLWTEESPQLMIVRAGNRDEATQSRVDSLERKTKQSGKVECHGRGTDKDWLHRLLELLLLVSRRALQTRPTLVFLGFSPSICHLDQFCSVQYPTP